MKKTGFYLQFIVAVRLRLSGKITFLYGRTTKTTYLRQILSGISKMIWAGQNSVRHSTKLVLPDIFDVRHSNKAFLSDKQAQADISDTNSSRYWALRTLNNQSFPKIRVQYALSLWAPGMLKNNCFQKTGPSMYSYSGPYSY